MQPSDAPDLPEHVLANREHWDSTAHEWVSAGERSWASDEPFWGVWSLPESELQMLPADMSGMDAVELGCGTGYVSGWMARRGARVVGIDNSENQLASARRFAEEHGAALELVHGNAETTPFADAAFDFAISEYGAAIWCDPYAWIPEAHRILRPGGRLVFLGTTPLATVTMPLNGAMCETTLHRSYFDLHQIDWREVEIDPGGVEFTLPISKWIRLFRDVGFDVEDYLELRAPADQQENKFQSPAAWAKRWPYEHVWKLRKRT
ncbi:MAG: methyltransferase domain-containing protein [Planctomycetota bacterium]|nr:methyltransferase domain-containing protein [Planctomycetota bacterium]